MIEDFRTEDAHVGALTDIGGTIVKFRAWAALIAAENSSGTLACNSLLLNYQFLFCIAPAWFPAPLELFLSICEPSVTPGLGLTYLLFCTINSP